VILFFVACATRGEFSNYADALRAYDEGRAALSKNAPEESVAAFERARAADPESPVLVAWLAKALVAAGRVDEALAEIDDAERRYPEDTTLHYNRAALLARKGRADEAVAELQALVAKGSVSFLDIQNDADFALLVDDPQFKQLLPSDQVRVSLRGEGGAVLVGETFIVRLSITSRAGEGITFTDMGKPSGLLHHQRTVEDVAPRKDGLVDREIEVTWRAVAPGKATIGPWLVASGGTSALTDDVAVDVKALGDRATKLEPLEANAVSSPASLVGDRPTPWAGRIGDALVVKTAPGTRHTFTWDGDLRAEAPPEELVYREAGQPVWTAWAYRGEGSAQVQVERQKEVLLDAHVE
jgi:hypothetical protein